MKAYQEKEKEKESTTKNTAQTSGKMFGQNEGTYVDFEEVK